MRRIAVSAFALLLIAAGPVRADQAERNKRVVRGMTEAVNARDFAALDELVAADLTRHSAATPDFAVRNREQFKEFLKADLAAVPDAQIEIVSMLSEGDRVAVHAIYRGTQTGAMGPFPPSGKRVELPFLSILRLERGKIAEMWVEWDNLAALAQLGHFPPSADGEGAPAAEGSGQRMSAEARKALARRWFDEVINQRNLNAIGDIYAPSYVHHGPEGQEIRGLEAVRAFAATILSASYDRHAVVEHQVVEGDVVVTRFTSRGRHSGPLRGVEPTGKVWTTEGIVISRIEDGQIVEDWEVIHVSGL